ncbi:MAG: TIGR04282 family arsenosugar biosynthesis glycosyltransferase [Anaerolineales bacterium]|jgi:rSAM/selenodomain-associated transferase 1
MPPELSNALIVVAKRPAPGRTKTRLSPPLTPQMASQLYECFLLDTLDQMRQVKDTQKVIAYFSEPEYFQRLAPDFQLIQQVGSDLGARLDHVLTTYLSLGYQRVVIIDSDSPTLPSTYLSQSFIGLADGADVCLGPCEDGGYYLIGGRQPIPRLLREVHMSTPTVAADTIALAKEEGLRLSLLPIWYDVDDIASLARLVKECDIIDSQVATNTHNFLRENTIRRLVLGESEI